MLLLFLYLPMEMVMGERTFIQYVAPIAFISLVMELSSMAIPLQTACWIKNQVKNNKWKFTSKKILRMQNIDG